MAYPVVWSPVAKLTYYQILEYLEEKWAEKELKTFINRTEEVINHIRKNPRLYPYSNESKTYKCVVVKQISLFYQFNQQKVELVLFWDNRQNPAKLPL